MKKALLLIPALLILASCNQAYKNEYGIGYTDPDTALPAELKLSQEELEGTFFSSKPREDGQLAVDAPLCQDGTEPKIIPLFQSETPMLDEVKRSAYICGDQYVIYDFQYEEAYYGIFNLKDHTVIEKNPDNK